MASRQSRTLRSSTTYIRIHLQHAHYLPNTISTHHHKAIKRVSLTERECLSLFYRLSRYGDARFLKTDLVNFCSNSMGKKTPYATHTNIDALTPDYSAPEVVTGQAQSHLHGGQHFMPVPYGDSTGLSQQMSSYSFKEHVDLYKSMSQSQSAPPPVPTKGDRSCGMRRRTFWILGSLLIILIAMGVGLGVGLTMGHKEERLAHTYLHSKHR
jgi:hypothetical protein